MVRPNAENTITNRTGYRQQIYLMFFMGSTISTKPLYAYIIISIIYCLKENHTLILTTKKVNPLKLKIIKNYLVLPETRFII